MPAFPLPESYGRAEEKYMPRALTELSAGDVLEIAGEKNDHTTGSAVKKGHTFSFLVRKQVRLQSGTTLRRIRNGSLLKRINDEFTGRPLQRAGIRNSHASRRFPRTSGTLFR